MAMKALVSIEYYTYMPSLPMQQGRYMNDFMMISYLAIEEKKTFCEAAASSSATSVYITAENPMQHAGRGIFNCETFSISYSAYILSLIHI